MEWSEALKLIGGARTSVMRTIEKLSLLRDEDFILYKNRKLLREEWVLNFWKNVSLASQGKELL